MQKTNILSTLTIDEQNTLYNEMFHALVKQIIADYQSGKTDALEDLLLTNIDITQLINYLPEEVQSKYAFFLLPLELRTKY